MASISIMSGRFLAGVVLVGVVLGAPAAASAQGPREHYARALARERPLRDSGTTPTARQIRDAVAAYERFVHRYPTSGYSDNALWQAGNLSLLAYQRFGQDADRRTGLRLLNQLKASYPSSSLLIAMPRSCRSSTTEHVRTRDMKRAARPAPSTSAPAASSAVRPAAIDRERQRPVPPGTRRRLCAVETVAIRGITRTLLPHGIRVSIELDGEIGYRLERLDNPRRVFFDLRNARPVASLLDATLKFPEDAVQEIRLGRRPQNTTRVVMDMSGVDHYSVFTLYNPYRVVVDFHRAGAAAEAAPARLPAAPASPVNAGPVLVDESTDGRTGDSRVPWRRRRRSTRPSRSCRYPRAPRRLPALLGSGGAVRELERTLLYCASARARACRESYGRRPRRARSRGARQRHQGSRAGAGCRAEAAQAARRTARDGGRDDPRHRRVHPARGAHRDRQPRGGGPVPLDPCECQPQHQGPAASRPTSSTSPRTPKRRRLRRARTPPRERRCTACRRSCARSRSTAR